MTADEINALTDSAFQIINEAMTGKVRHHPARLSVAMEFVRTVQLVAWSRREEQREQAVEEAANDEKRVNEWTDHIGDK